MLIEQFKKDYLPYLVGIIVPALINFLTIPLLKNVLGSSDFGVYTFYLSILLIINSSLAGGINQSIIRLQAENEGKKSFFTNALTITFFTSTIVGLPLFIYGFLNQNHFLFALVFSGAFFLSNIYTSLLAITQSRFLSVNSAISESIRTILFLALSFLLLQLLPATSYLILIFIALFASYLFGICYLFFVNRFLLFPYALQWKSITSTGKLFFQYGSYLIGWFFFSYGTSMANRFILAHYYGKESIGHFTASFDIINKSIIFLLSPVLLSMFPLVVKAYSEGQYVQVKKLINQLMMGEILLLIICLPLYLFFGFPILSRLLHTPETTEYLWLNIEVIAGTFIWQIAMLQHKFLELSKKTKNMLLFVVISFSSGFLVDMLLIPKYGIFAAGFGFITSVSLYLIMVVIFSNKFLEGHYKERV